MAVEDSKTIKYNPRMYCTYSEDGLSAKLSLQETEIIIEFESLEDRDTFEDTFL